MLPLHPHCHCRYIGHYSKVHKIVVKNPQLSTMQKFSLNEQRQIVGSYAKLQEFHNGEDITKLFNRVRPDYPVGFCHDVFGYNGGMKKFSDKTITHQEKKSITAWTDDSSSIKHFMWGISDDKVSKEHSETLFGLFNKYSSNVKTGKILYRGMAVPNNLFEFMGYDKLVKGSDYTPDNKAISSFSSSKKVAYDFAFDGEHKQKVIIKIKSHNEDMLDITSVSSAAKEEETILTKNIWYNIVHIRKSEYGGVKWMLIVLKKK